jgi:hypothetical protein
MDLPRQQENIVGASGRRIRQTHQGLGQAIHRFGRLVGTRELIGTQFFHAFLNALLNPPGIGFPKLKTQERIVVGRPRIRGKLKTRANPFVAHDATTIHTDCRKTRQSPLQPFFWVFSL